MTHYLHYKDPNSPEMIGRLKELPKCPGVCFFIDLINSTNIKYKTEVVDWGRKLNNTFNFISFLNDFPDNVVKGIGDEIMLYIPDEELGKKSVYKDYFSILLELYATLDNIKNFPGDDDFLKCKVGIHYCTDVYNISFFQDAHDYYGRDIDLTARLMSKTVENRIVMSEKFYQKVKHDVSQYPDDQGKHVFEMISEKYIEDFKGVPKSTEFRVINV